MRFDPISKLRGFTQERLSTSRKKEPATPQDSPTGLQRRGSHQSANTSAPRRPPPSAAPPGSPQAISTFLSNVIKKTEFPTAAEMLAMSSTPGKRLAILEGRDRTLDLRPMAQKAMEDLKSTLGTPQASSGELLAALVSRAPELKKDEHIGADDQFTALALARTTLKHLDPPMTVEELTRLATAALDVSTRVGHEAHRHHEPTERELDRQGPYTIHRQGGRAHFRKDSTSGQALKLATEAISRLKGLGVERLDDGLVAAAAKALAEAPAGDKGQRLSDLHRTLTANMPREQRQAVQDAISAAGRSEGFLENSAAPLPKYVPDPSEPAWVRPARPTPKNVGDVVSQALQYTEFVTGADLLQMNSPSSKGHKEEFADFSKRIMDQLRTLGPPNRSNGDVLGSLVSAAPELRRDRFIGGDQQFSALAIARTVVKHHDMTDVDLGKVATAALEASTRVGSEAHLHDTGSATDRFSMFDGMRKFARGFKRDTTSNQALKLASESIDKMLAPKKDGPDPVFLSDDIVKAATTALLEAPTGKGRHISQLYNALIKGITTEQRSRLDRALHDADRLGLATKYQ